MTKRPLSKTSSELSPPPFELAWQHWLRSPTVTSVLLTLVTLIVYGSVARNDFVNYDDPDYITSNSHVQTGLSWGNVSWAFTACYASNWHPLTWLSHILDHEWFGNRPGPQHLVNLGFHLANTALLFLLLRRVTGAQWRSAAVAGLFALHPLHVESVAWLSERKDVLSTLFFLLTLGKYVRYAQSVSGNKRGEYTPGAHSEVIGRRARALNYSLALLFFTLGLMSKPMLVTVPFLLLLFDYWPLARFSFKTKSELRLVSRLLLEKVPFLVLAIASCVITYVAQERGGAVSTTLALNGRLANAVVSYARYLWKTLYPVDLSVLYPHPGYWPAASVVASACVFLTVSALVLWQVRVRPYLFVGWAWFVGALVPAIGIVQVGIQAMADRYTYLPLIGLFIALVWGLGDLPASGGRRRRLLGACAAISLFGCAALTVRQVHFWRNSATLFQRAVRVTPNNYLAYNNLGFYLSGQGNAAAAMTNYVEALRIKPDYEDALNNLGYALAGMKRYPEAIGYYERALQTRPDQVEVRNNLGNALSELGKLDAAIEQYHLVLRTSPEHADAHNNLGIALAMQGKLDEAIPHFQAAIRFKPSYASAHSNLGNAYAVQHRLAEAIREYQISLDLNPNDAQAYNNLGNALTEQGKLDEAIGQYTQALALNANNPEARLNLGMVFARQGKTAEAKAQYQEALRLRPDYAAAQRQLQLLGSH